MCVEIVKAWSMPDMRYKGGTAARIVQGKATTITSGISLMNIVEDIAILAIIIQIVVHSERCG